MNIKNSKAKKTRRAILSVFLIVALIVGGAFAFLSTTDSKTNVFTIGNVKAELIEKFDKNLDGEIDADTEIFDSTNTPEDKRIVADGYLVPGQEIIKQPYAKNVGANPFRLYMSVQIPAAKASDLTADNGELQIDPEQEVIVKAYAIQDMPQDDVTVKGIWDTYFPSAQQFGDKLDDSVARENIFSLKGLDTTHWEAIDSYQSVTDEDTQAGYSCYVYAYKGTGDYLLAKDTESEPLFTSVVLNERLGEYLDISDTEREGDEHISYGAPNADGIPQALMTSCDLTYTDPDTGNTVRGFNNLAGFKAFFKAKYNDNSDEKLSADNPITTVSVEVKKSSGRLSTGSVLRVTVTKTTTAGVLENVTDYIFVKFGDVNGDSMVNAIDCTIIQGIAAQDEDSTFSQAQLLAANVYDARTSRPTYDDYTNITSDAITEDDYNALASVLNNYNVINSNTGTISYTPKD